MAYKFDEEPDLGKVVKGKKLWSKLTKNMDVPTFKDIVGDFTDAKYPGLAGRKWSRLCGFSFRSAIDGTVFQFVFVPKLKGTLSRNQQGLSGWYCWTLNGKDNKQVTSIEAMKKRFGFNVNKFVHSDLFDEGLAMFKENVIAALNNQVAELLKNPPKDSDDEKELNRYVKAVRDSVAKMDEVKQFVTPEDKYDDSGAPEYARGSAPKVGHAKIAYNADKTYDLRNIDKAAQGKPKPVVATKPDAALDEPVPEPAAQKKSYIKFDPSMKHKFGGGYRKPDSEIFDKYDDYDNDDFR